MGGGTSKPKVVDGPEETYAVGETEGKENARQLATPAQSLKKIIHIEKVAPRKVEKQSGRIRMHLTVTDPEDAVDVGFTYISQTGYYPSDLNKLNQDSVRVFHQSQRDHDLGIPAFSFYGVFDGHGKLGDLCSNFAKDKVLENFRSSEHLPKGEIELALREAFAATNKQMHAESSYGVLDDSLSGTTAVVLVLYENYLYCANTGDSRAIACLQAGERLITEPLSIDQTPFRKDERDRCVAAGARIMTVAQLQGLAKPGEDFGTPEDNGGDPPRIWLQQSPVPGKVLIEKAKHN